MFALWSRAQRKSRNREYKNSMIFSRFFFSHRSLRTIANTIVIIGRRSITSGTRFLCCLFARVLGTLCCLLQFNCLLVVVWSRDLYPAPPRCSGLQQQTRLATVSPHYLQATLSSWLVRVMIYGLFCLWLCDRGAYRRILLFLVGVLNTSDLDTLRPPYYLHPSTLRPKALAT